MNAVVAAFNQEKALVGAFSVITNLRMELFEALVPGDRGQDTVFLVQGRAGLQVPGHLQQHIHMPQVRTRFLTEASNSKE